MAQGQNLDNQDILLAGTNTGAIALSVNGQSWSCSDSGLSRVNTLQWVHVTGQDAFFVAAGYGGSLMAISRDGTEWIPVNVLTNTFSGIEIHAVTHNDSILIAGGDGGCTTVIDMQHLHNLLREKDNTEQRSPLFRVPLIEAAGYAQAYIKAD